LLRGSNKTTTTSAHIEDALAGLQLRKSHG
jgi:hypothetical protein